MLKKRLIFTLLHHSGQFMLSRNFRLQKVGDLRWLQTNYDFSRISFSIDELVVLDVTRGQRDSEAFCETLKALTTGCFVPIAAGGGLRSTEDARRLLRSGADKVVVNSLLYEDNDTVDQLAREFGQQCVIASMDVKRSTEGVFQAWTENGSRLLTDPASDWIRRVSEMAVGEIYLNSMDRDGTGQGYDIDLLGQLPSEISKPVILAGGAGNASHLAAGLANPHVDAVATAHLFNFVGDGLRRARNSLVEGGIDLPLWDIAPIERYLTNAGDHN